MANLHCYICDRRFPRRTMSCIDGEENDAKLNIAVQRRNAFNRCALEVTDLTRICINCNQSIRQEIQAIEEDPGRLRLNVLSQTRNGTCLICNAEVDLHRLSIECKANVFICRNIYIPENVKSCQYHLDGRGFLLPALLLDEEFECFSPITKDQFRELFTYCDRVPREGGYRYVTKKHLLMFLCKMRQGLSDDFVCAMFQYSSRQATSLAIATARQSLMQLKPVLIVAPDGWILHIQGPYFSDHSNNDAAILRNEFDHDAQRMRRWIQEDDIMIVDRGYRDAIPLFEQLGITWEMPALLNRNERQLSTEDANESRLVTKSRWIVEARNGHLRSIFKIFQHTVQIQHIPNIVDFYRIAGAIINRYHPIILMEGANAEMAQRLLERAREPNVVQALVEAENLHTRNAQRWVRLNAGQIQDFPILTIQDLKDLTFGIYQVKLAPSYVQDKLQREAEDELQVEMLRDQNRLPQPGFIRVRVFSRFRNSTRYQLWISYIPTDEQNETMEDGEDENENPIQGYYCSCKSGARTVGTCAHIASVVWLLGYAQYEENVHYPSTRLIESIQDAGNRPL
ncbi:hypothetical protein ALC62_01022 [Cyphomyrmex costatus]|uniref:SWIM-type domain-containing protein n=1 Tax=Cyphomyrmex costatus TaxID=456900 RepID=A0A151K261_9HYME|nr:hypothetical protein ALC62_01022 [Cyphomyrmex costatus]